MTVPAESPWETYRDRANAAVHAAPRDLIDFCAGLGEVELDAHHLAEILSYADECGALRGPVLRSHLADLRHMQADLAALVREAEEAQP